MQGYLLDMDGVLYRGTQPIDGAAEFIESLQRDTIPFLCLTNHSCYTTRFLSEKVQKLGLNISPEQIYTSSTAAVEWLTQRKIKTIFAIGEEGLKEPLASAQIEIHPTNAQCLVVGMDRDLDLKEIAIAYRLLKKDIPFVATNPDIAYPIDDGPAPECGFILAGLEKYSGRSPILMGKPEPSLFQMAAQHLKIPLKNLIMIGDRLDTDIAGGQNAGCQTALVLTGSTAKEDLATSRVHPGRVLSNLRELID
jgi:HAD superfamily hydrolase (TIGR01457 family)